MIRSRRRHPLLAAISAALVLMMGLAACSSDDGDAQTLDAFLGWGSEDPDVMEARFQQQETQVQELIRECMAREGFEYIPVDRSASMVFADDDLSEEERLRTQGLGITTWYGNEDDHASDSVEDDPNWELVSEMSQAEQQAYYDALHGSDEEMREIADIEYDPETGEEVGWSFSGYGPGCDGEARAEVYGDTSETQALWEELEPAFQELYERVEADPRMVEAQEEWANCMADAGYSQYRTQNEFYEQTYEDLEGRLQQIMGGSSWVDPFEGWSEAEVESFHETASQAELDELYREAERKQMESIDRDALEALQQEEIDLALANYECSGGENQWERYQEISAEYEAEFIAENREILEQIREAEDR